jgi:hypothetical protein
MPPEVGLARRLQAPAEGDGGLDGRAGGASDVIGQQREFLAAQKQGEPAHADLPEAELPNEEVGLGAGLPVEAPRRACHRCIRISRRLDRERPGRAEPGDPLACQFQAARLAGVAVVDRQPVPLGEPVRAQDREGALLRGEGGEGEGGVGLVVERPAREPAAEDRRPLRPRFPGDQRPQCLPALGIQARRPEHRRAVRPAPADQAREPAPQRPPILPRRPFPQPPHPAPNLHAFGEPIAVKVRSGLILLARHGHL